MNNITTPIKNIYGFKLILALICISFLGVIIFNSGYSSFIKAILGLVLVALFLISTKNKTFLLLKKEDDMQCVYKSSKYIKNLHIFSKIFIIIAFIIYIILLTTEDSTSSTILIYSCVFITHQSTFSLPYIGKKYIQTGDFYFKISDIISSKKVIKKGYIHYNLTLTGYFNANLTVKEKYLTQDDIRFLDETLLVS